MGGTSTDVSRYDGAHEYVFEHRVGDARLLAPALAIETVAAGGGSICRFAGGRLLVGPESAGAAPGPACYGAGGPLTLTDVNLLLGRLDPERFGIPVDRDGGGAPARGAGRRGRGGRRAARRRARPCSPAAWRSRTSGWRTRCAGSRCAAATTRPSTPWSPSAARAASTPPRSPTTSGSTDGAGAARTRASSRPWGWGRRWSSASRSARCWRRSTAWPASLGRWIEELAARGRGGGGRRGGGRRPRWWSAGASLACASPGRRRRYRSSSETARRGLPASPRAFAAAYAGALRIPAAGAADRGRVAARRRLVEADPPPAAGRSRPSARRRRSIAAGLVRPLAAGPVFDRDALAAGDAFAGAGAGLRAPRRHGGARRLAGLRDGAGALALRRSREPGAGWGRAHDARVGRSVPDARRRSTIAHGAVQPIVSAAGRRRPGAPGGGGGASCSPTASRRSRGRWGSCCGAPRVSTNVKERLDFSCALLDPRGRAGGQRAPHPGAPGRARPVRADGGRGAAAGAGRRGGHQPPGLRRLPPAGRHGGDAGVRARRSGRTPAPLARLRGEPRPPRRDRRHATGLDAAGRPQPGRRGGGDPADLAGGARRAALGRGAAAARRGALPEPRGRGEPRRPRGGGGRQPPRRRRRSARWPRPTAATTVREQMAVARGPAAERLAAALRGCRGRGPIGSSMPRSGSTTARRWSVSATVEDGRARISFAGSAPVHPGNLNATPAVVRSAVLYVLRLLVAVHGEDGAAARARAELLRSTSAAALDEGLLRPVALDILRLLARTSPRTRARRRRWSAATSRPASGWSTPCSRPSGSPPAARAR